MKKTKLTRKDGKVTTIKKVPKKSPLMQLKNDYVDLKIKYDNILAECKEQREDIQYHVKNHSEQLLIINRLLKENESVVIGIRNHQKTIIGLYEEIKKLKTLKGFWENLWKNIK